MDAEVNAEMRRHYGFNMAYPAGVAGPAVDPNGTEAQHDLYSDLLTIFQALQAVSNNGLQSVGGGGTPRVPTKPPICGAPDYQGSEAQPHLPTRIKSDDDGGDAERASAAAESSRGTHLWPAAELPWLAHLIADPGVLKELRAIALVDQGADGNVDSAFAAAFNPSWDLARPAMGGGVIVMQPGVCFV
jgi:hypothetical protein